MSHKINNLKFFTDENIQQEIVFYLRKEKFDVINEKPKKNMEIYKTI